MLHRVRARTYTHTDIYIMLYTHDTTARIHIKTYAEHNQTQ